ncbi:7-carboxy-7-deazaguanine synthase [Candidatus Methanoplasma termitum]|uniref:7-carboxy-7-deazaguanine synthase n=1 Tax=Candidatus Methanoplasma termitum TaxID=1577791 RepID=A0A0A7LAD7_9ARCH|nr:radical SAM protein [Candidatus Methanoplasma termitum]AIZ56080.1 7-carboxy-7-deazaguanine synthase [Candidatus Methanoplasma termitum]MCL2333790.1 radical SAM protein [Candidatus Methanoplasma sp.]
MKICEYFGSIQGEGITIGIPTYFIRTAGCNLRCEWCDTAYAWEGGMETSVDEIMEIVDDTENVCVTGGEPLLQKDMPELIDRLLEAGKRIVIETNGSKDISVIPKNDNIIISMDVKCPSSGMSDKNLSSNLRYLGKKDQIKFVIGNHVDLNYAIRFIRENPVDANIIFGAVGGMDLLHIAEEVINRKLNVRVLPQLHKIIWGDKGSV